jgi:hypothetical protein
MVYSFTWAWYKLNTTTWTDFSAGNLIGFYGTTTYGARTRITVYNVGMHLRTSSGVDTDACANSHMTGVQYIAVGTCKVNGGATVNLNTVTANESVRIIFTDGATAISTESGIFYAYDGAVDTNVPTAVTAQGAEQGDAAWTGCGGSAAAVTLTNQASNITHTFYVIMSASPDTVGEKTAFAWKIQLDYY